MRSVSDLYQARFRNLRGDKIRGAWPYHTVLCSGKNKRGGLYQVESIACIVRPDGCALRFKATQPGSGYQAHKEDNEESRQRPVVGKPSQSDSGLHGVQPWALHVFVGRTATSMLTRKSGSKHKFQDSMWIVYCNLLCNHPAHGKAQDVGGRYLKAIHEANDVVCQ